MHVAKIFCRVKSMTIILAMRVSAYDDSDVVMMIALPYVFCEVRLFEC